jgi:hypothetical protein
VLGSCVAACGGDDLDKGKAQLTGSPAPKRLIEFGWDRPTPDLVRRRIADMDLPFDGVVFTLHVGPIVFTRTTYPDAAFGGDQEDLRATRSMRLTHNFVLVWATRGEGWDWFNDADWQVTETNVRNIVRTAALGNCTGIFFDTEPYNGATWYYPEQPRRQERSFGEYERQVYRRGARFMQVIQEEMPRATIILTWGPATALPRQGAWRDVLARRRYLEAEGYGLLAAFIDGALSAATPGISLVDGHEAAYFLATRNGFIESLRGLRTTPAIDIHNRDEYLRHYRFANAVFVDWILNLGNDPTLFGYYLESVADRLKLLEHNTYYALTTSDEYAWVYSAHMNWWTGDVPVGAVDAIRNAKRKVDEGLPLGFDIDTAPRFAAARQAYELKTARAPK